MSSADRTTTSDNPVTVFLVDDHPPIRKAVRSSLEATAGMDVCGEARTAASAARRIEETGPDVAVVELSLPRGHGLDLVKRIQAQAQTVDVLVFSVYDEAVFAGRAIQAGASGYLMKTEPTGRLVEAIRTIDDGEVALSDALSSRLLNQLVRNRAPESHSAFDALTDRELEVFQMLGEGKSLDDVGDDLHLSRKTVETYRRRAKEKLGFDTVSDLLRYAVWWTHGKGANSAALGEAPVSVGPPS
jgi:DNA-binding NarL/FixJ family response regulator